MHNLGHAFSSDGFMPHGFCFLWNARLLWLHALSDGLTFAAYLSIPFALIYFARRRPDLPYRWMFGWFGAFIISCGFSHGLDVWTLWHPDYWVSGVAKAVTAIASVATVILLLRVIRPALAMPRFEAVPPAAAGGQSRLTAVASRPLWLAYGIAVVTTAATLLVLEAGAPEVPASAPIIVFVLPVILSAYIGGLVPGLLSTALATLTSIYLVLPPTHTWRVTNAADNVKWVALSAAGTLISVLMADRERLHAEQAPREVQGRLLSTERRVRVAFAFLLACLVGIAAVSYPTVARLREDTARVEHSEQEIAALRLLLSAATDAETGERGFIITGQEEYLEPYQAALQSVHSTLAELRRLTADNPLQQRSCDVLEPLVAERLKVLKDGIEVRRRHFDLAETVVASGKGKRLQDRIREIVAQMEESERGYLQERELLARHATAVAEAVILGGSALAVLIVSAGLLVIGQAFAASRRAEWALEESRDQLDARVRERTAELTQSNESLHSSEERFRTLANAIPTLCWMAEANGWISWYNQRWYEYTGATPGKMEGWGWQSVHDPQVLPKVLESWKASIATGQPFEMIFPLRGADDQFHPFLTRVLPLRDREGKVVQWFGTNTDVSEQQKIQEALRQRAEELEKVMKVAPVGIWVAHDPDVSQITGNPMANQMYEAVEGENLSAGRTSDDSVPRRLFFRDGRELALDELPMQAAARGEEVMGVEMDVRLPSGRLLSMFGGASPLRDANGQVRGCVGAFLDITERKRAEEAARKTRLMFERFFEFLPEAIVAADTEGSIRQVNAEAEKSFGYGRAELLGQPVEILMPERFRGGHRGHRQAYIAAPHSRAMGSGLPLYGRRKDGTEFPADIQLSTIDTEEGLRVVSVTRDITDRKRAEEALRQSLERLERVLEVETVGVMFWDLNTGCMVDANDAFLKLMGYSRSEVEARELTWQNLTPPEYMDVSRAEVAKFMATGRVGPYEKEYFRKDGTKRWLLFAGSSLGNNQCVEFCIDISDRKEAGIRLAQSEQKYRRLHESIRDAFAITDMRGQIQDCNQVFLNMLGYTMPEARELSDNDITPAKWHPIEARILQGQVLKRGYSETYEKEYRRKNGTVFPVELRTYLVKDHAGEPFQMWGIVRDITERKQTEEALAHKVKELARSNADLEQFAYVASHDLQEPLRMVASFTQLLAKRYRGQLDADADQFIGYAVEGAQRMQMLINDLLVYSRVGTRGKPLAPTSSEAVLGAALTNLQAAIAETRARVTHDPLPTVWADPDQLAQVFQNLVGNALKFHDLAPPRVHVSAEREKDGWRFSVRDDGIGIDPAHAERIFVIFERLHTRAEYPGTGLGLAISKKIVERHGGRIGVNSAPGQGSTFYFTLPDQSPDDRGPGLESYRPSKFES